MSQSSVLYCESWDVTQHFPDKAVCKIKYTLMISKAKEGYELRIVESYVNTPDGVGDVIQMPSPYPNLNKCVECALDRMHDNKTMVGLFNLDTGVSIEEIIPGLTGFTQEGARRFSLDEVYPVIDNRMVAELCNTHESDKETWDRLVERVNKSVAYHLHHAYEYRSARTKHGNQNE